MAWIKTIVPEEATGELKEHYDVAHKRAGHVFQILRLQGLNPRALAASTDLYQALMLAPGSLSRATREMLATVVSATNGCFYWIEAHGEDLRAVTHDGQLAEQIKKDYRQALLDAKTLALLDFAVAVTQDVHSVNKQTLDQLRELGWSDEEILTATHIIGFFNYYNRLADALGVDLEDFMKGPGA